MLEHGPGKSLPRSAAIACRLDVTSEADWDAAITLTEERFGILHALVNNAGIGTGAAGPQPVEALPAVDWRRVLEVNLTGNFLGLHASAALLRRSAEKLRERDPVATAGPPLPGTLGFRRNRSSTGAEELR